MDGWTWGWERYKSETEKKNKIQENGTWIKLNMRLRKVNDSMMAP